MVKNKLDIAIKSILTKSMPDKKIKILDADKTDLWPSFRAEHYLLTISVDGEEKKIFVKDYNLAQKTDTQGFQRSIQFNFDEPMYLSILTKNKGLIPFFYGSEQYANGNNHLVMLSELYDSDLENTLSKIEPSEVFSDNTNYNILKKSIDAFLINNEKINKVLKTDIERGEVYVYDKKEVAIDLSNYMNSLLQFFFPINEGNPQKHINEIRNQQTEWMVDNNYSTIIRQLNAVIGEKIGDVRTQNDGLLLLDFLPYHVLLKGNFKENLKGDYNKDALVERLLNPENDKFYEDIAITDYNKIGISQISLPLARFLNHPSIMDLLPPQKKREEIIDHLIDYSAMAILKSRLLTQNISETDENYLELKTKLRREFNLCSRVAILKNVHSVIQLYYNHREVYDEWIKQKNIYEIDPFVIGSLRNLTSLRDPFAEFELFNKGMNSLVESRNKTIKQTN